MFNKVSTMNNKGIWQHEIISRDIAEGYKLTLGEGNTPLQFLTIDGVSVGFKREDLNPNRSFKDRSLAYQVAFYAQQGKKDFVISSSGNAATSAIAYCSLASANLTVFVSDDIPEYKWESIQSVIKKYSADVKFNNSKVIVIKSKRSKSDAIKYALQNNAQNLRGSVDENAVVGFKTISYELSTQYPDADAIFTCCSSGTSTLGIYNGYLDLSNKEIPKLNIVQTSKVYSIAKEFDTNFVGSNDSLANAVSDKVAHRKSQIINVINQTHGFGWVVDDGDLKRAKEILVQESIDIEGYNAYVGFAGYLKAIENGKKYKNPVCIISGI